MKIEFETALLDRIAKARRVVSTLDESPVDTEAVLSTADPRVKGGWSPAAVAPQTVILHVLSDQRRTKGFVPTYDAVLRASCHSRTKLGASAIADAVAREINRPKAYPTVDSAVGRIQFLKATGRPADDLDQVTRLYGADVAIEMTYSLDQEA